MAEREFIPAVGGGSMPAAAVRSSARPSWESLLSPIEPWRMLWARRDLTRQFAVRMFLQRYRGTALGPLWSALLPLAMIGVYTFVFSVVFKAKWTGSADEATSTFVMALFCGIITYGIFGESVVRAAGLVLENPNFVKKVIFPLEILVPASLASSMMYALVGLVLVAIGSVVFVGKIGLMALWLPVVLVPLVFLSLGVGWFVAGLGVYVRDVSTIIVLVVQQILFFMTPVLYRREAIPEAYRWVADWNPLTPIVDSARRVLLFNESPDWMGLGLVTVLGLVVMQLGYGWFMATKRGFADVI